MVSKGDRAWVGGRFGQATLTATPDGGQGCREIESLWKLRVDSVDRRSVEDTVGLLRLLEVVDPSVGSHLREHAALERLHHARSVDPLAGKKRSMLFHARR